MSIVRAISIVAPVVVAACVAPPSPLPPRAVVHPAAPPRAPSLPSAARVAALTPGTWTYRRDAKGGLALYDSPGSDAVLTIRCDRGARQIYISRPGGLTATMTLHATSGSRGYPARPTGGIPPYIAIAIDANDRQLDAIAFSRGQFTISADGQADVVVPSWPEMSRVIEDCRG